MEGQQSMKAKDYTVRKDVESYGGYWIGWGMNETDEPQPMTLKQANYISRCVCGYVIKIHKP
jgi:hypothetical protein